MILVIKCKIIRKTIFFYRKECSKFHKNLDICVANESNSIFHASFALMNYEDLALYSSYKNAVGYVYQ